MCAFKENCTFFSSAVYRASGAVYDSSANNWAVLDPRRAVLDPPRVVFDPPRAVSDQPRAVSDQPRAVSDRPRVVSDRPRPRAVSDQPRAVSDRPWTVFDQPRAVSDRPWAVDREKCSSTQMIDGWTIMADVKGVGSQIYSITESVSEAFRDLLRRPFRSFPQKVPLQGTMLNQTHGTLSQRKLNKLKVWLVLYPWTISCMFVADIMVAKPTPQTTNGSV